MQKPGSLSNTLAPQIAHHLQERKETISVAESSTAGLISASLLAIPGASAYFKGGSVVYTLESRKVLLDLTRDDVEGLEPLTEAMAMRFAEQAANRLNSTWAIAELGVAGPSGAPYGHPPGISVIAIDGPAKISTIITTGSADREQNMWEFTEGALGLLAQALADSA